MGDAQFQITSDADWRGLADTPAKLARAKSNFGKYVQGLGPKPFKGTLGAFTEPKKNASYVLAKKRLVDTLFDDITHQLEQGPATVAALRAELNGLRQAADAAPAAQQAVVQAAVLAATAPLQDQLNAMAARPTQEKLNVIQLYLIAAQLYAAFKSRPEPEQTAANAADVRTALNRAIEALGQLTEQQMPEAEREAYAFAVGFRDALPAAAGGARRRKSRKSRKSQRKSRKANRKAHRNTRKSRKSRKGSRKH